MNRCLSYLFIILLTLLFMGRLYAEPVTIKMYKQAGCMCCDKHARILEQQGFNVELETHKNLNWLKSELGINKEFVGCHTMLVDDYIVEGHIPGNIIQKLIAEKPDIRGIALPGMPVGTPGMPGERDELLDVYVIKDGDRTVYDRF